MTAGEFLDWKPAGRWQLIDGASQAMVADFNVREPDIAVTCAEWGADAKVRPNPSRCC
jgi:hypothetical protein